MLRWTWLRWISVAAGGTSGLGTVGLAAGQQSSQKGPNATAAPSVMTPISTARLPTSVKARRKWESSLHSVIALEGEEKVEALAKEHDRVYTRKEFTPVEKAFPLTDSTRWAELPKLAQPITRKDDAGACVVKVAIVGPPNSGKSTLLNSLVTSHVSSSSSMEGTTKDWVKGVSTLHDTQLIFLDTPGIFHVESPKDRERHLEHTYAAWDSLFSADVVLLVLRVGLGFLTKEQRAVVREVLTRCSQRELPTILALTQMDRVRSPFKRELYVSLRNEIDGNPAYRFAKVFEVSAKAFSGIVELKDFLALYGDRGNWRYFRTQVTDLNDADRVSEHINEAFFRFLPGIVPHRTRHKIIGWTQKDAVLLIDVEVFFEKPGFMYIFFSKLALISSSVRTSVNKMLERRCRVVFHAFVTPGGVRRK